MQTYKLQATFTVALQALYPSIGNAKSKCKAFFVNTLGMGMGMLWGRPGWMC